MSELPDNWSDIKNDKAFWEEVKRMISSDELHEAQYYEDTVKRLISVTNVELNDDEFDPGIYEEELHLLAIAAVLNANQVFSVFFNDQYGEDNSSSVNELAGKFYVANWSDRKMVIGPNDTIEDAAEVVLSCYSDGTFTGANSDLPIEQMRKLCAQSVPMGGGFAINGVRHTMTKAGLVPA